MTREKIVENWSGLVPAHQKSNLRQLLLVSGDENKRILDDIEETDEQTDLDTATGEELEKHGDLVGVNRKGDEGDEKLRIRIKAEYIAQASNATYVDFVRGVAEILDTQTQNIEPKTPPETEAKVIEMNLGGALIDSIPLTDAELGELFSKMISIDARIEILRFGTFAFDGDDDSLEGFNQGTWSIHIN